MMFVCLIKVLDSLGLMGVETGNDNLGGLAGTCALVTVMDGITTAPMVMLDRDNIHWPMVLPYMAATFTTVPIGISILAMTVGTEDGALPLRLKRAFGALIIFFVLVQMAMSRYRAKLKAKMNSCGQNAPTSIRMEEKNCADPSEKDDRGLLSVDEGPSRQVAEQESSGSSAPSTHICVPHSPGDMVPSAGFETHTETQPTSDDGSRDIFQGRPHQDFAAISETKDVDEEQWDRVFGPTQEAREGGGGGRRGGGSSVESEQAGRKQQEECMLGYNSPPGGKQHQDSGAPRLLGGGHDTDGSKRVCLQNSVPTSFVQCLLLLPGRWHPWRTLVVWLSVVAGGVAGVLGGLFGAVTR